MGTTSFQIIHLAWIYKFSCMSLFLLLFISHYFISVEFLCVCINIERISIGIELTTVAIDQTRANNQ